MPLLINIGCFLWITPYILSWIANPSVSDAGDTIISLISRLVFLYLSFFFLQNRQHLRWAFVLLIITGVLTSLLTLRTSLVFGFGFNRLPETDLIPVQQSLGVLGWMVVLNTQFVTAPALLLLTYSNEIRRKLPKILSMILVVFMFAMSFAAQYRREVLLTVPILLIICMLDKNPGQRKSALLILIIIGGLFTALFLNSQILERRLTVETQAGLQGNEARLVSGQIGLQAFAAQPLLGYGPNSYVTTATNIRPGLSYHYNYYPYNSFLWVAVEAGLFSALGLILIFLGAYREIRKYQSLASGIEGWILRSAPAILVLILIWFSFGNAVDLSLPWFLFGSILAAANIARETVVSEM